MRMCLKIKQSLSSAFILPAKPIARSSPSQFGHLVGENRTNPLEPVFAVIEVILRGELFYFRGGISVYIYIFKSGLAMSFDCVQNL